MHFDMQICCFVSPVTAMILEYRWYLKRSLDFSICAKNQIPTPSEPQASFSKVAHSCFTGLISLF